MVWMKGRACAEVMEVGVRGKHVLEFISNKKEFIVFFYKTRNRQRCSYKDHRSTAARFPIPLK